MSCSVLQGLMRDKSLKAFSSLTATLPEANELISNVVVVIHWQLRQRLCPGDTGGESVGLTLKPFLTTVIFTPPEPVFQHSTPDSLVNPDRAPAPSANGMQILMGNGVWMWGGVTPEGGTRAGQVREEAMSLGAGFCFLLLQRQNNPAFERVTSPPSFYSALAEIGTQRICMATH